MIRERKQVPGRKELSPSAFCAIQAFLKRETEGNMSTQITLNHAA